MKTLKHDTLSAVYVIGVVDGPQKIGIALDPPSRAKDLQVGNHAELRLVHQVQVPSLRALAVERHAHWLLRAHRIRGEWFSCSPEEARQAVETAKAAVENKTAEAERMELEEPRTFGARPNPLTPEGFRMRLAGLGYTQSDFARVMAQLGDTRPAATILRTVQELARPDRTAPTPWALYAIFGVLDRLAAEGRLPR